MERDVTQIAEEAGRRRDLTGFWEVLRTVSGLIAALAVAAIVAGAVAQGEPPQAAPLTAAPPAAPAVPPEPDAIVISGPPQHALHVFYLVQTPGQEEFAHWGENEGGFESYSVGITRLGQSYDVLYAGSEEEQRIAAQRILDKILDYSNPVIVDVIDLRSIAGTHLR